MPRRHKTTQFIALATSNSANNSAQTGLLGKYQTAWLGLDELRKLARRIPKRPNILRSPFNFRLIVQDNAQQRAVDFHVAVVIDEAQFSKFVHELVHTRPRSTDHLSERLLADLRNDWFGSALLAKISQQKKCPRQAFLA